ncbi:FAD-dependent oxidoreductase [Amycolatopsis sp. NPDC005232]|uniref:FAD-binding oxidoreductase n=1 Tax=Amycolatopsis sp. NPDC005232 TaxID=3157027 RepID=UPI0033A66A97
MTKLVLPSVLRDRAVRPGDRRYPLFQSTYVRTASPALILVPESADELAVAVTTARDSGLQISIRSGGHSLAGRSSNDGGIVLDLSALRQVDVLDTGTRRVQVGAGARWAHVAEALSEHGWAISSGDHGNVGVGGIATAGGIGWFVRRYGLTIDHIHAVDVVLADGTQVHADHDHHPDLFWAMRGAGENVGIATSFEIDAAPIRNVGYANVVVEADLKGETVRRWSEYMAQAPRELTTTVALFPRRGGFAAQFTAVVANEDGALIRQLVEPLTRFGVRPLNQAAQVVPYTALVSRSHVHPNLGQQPSTTTNALLPTLTAASAEAIMTMADHPNGPLVQLRALGGAINDADSATTAYAHRHQEVLVIVTQFPPVGGVELDVVTKSLVPYADGAYRSFESRPDERTFRKAFPGRTGDRVLRLRDRFDPDGVFRRPPLTGEPTR